MGKRHIRRSDQDLVEISNHLLYEIQMLFETARALATADRASERDVRMWATHNALLESFIIHARVLLDFLYSSRRKPDDVIAQDFLDNASAWLQQRPKKSRLLKTSHKRVGKELAHLTYARLAVTPDEKQWQFVDIANEIGGVLKKFLRLVPEWRVSDPFRGFLSQAVSAEGEARPEDAVGG